MHFTEGLPTLFSSPWLAITRASRQPIPHVEGAASLPLLSCFLRDVPQAHCFPGLQHWHLHRFAVVHPHFNPWQVSAGLVSALPCPFTGFSRHVLEHPRVDLINAEAASLAFQPLYSQVSFQLVSTSSLFLNRRPPNPSHIGDGGP